MSLKFKLAWGASIVIISWCCGAPMMFLFFNLMGREYVVSSIAAPDYPGSRLQSRETGGGRAVPGLNVSIIPQTAKTKF